tara:strand:- start:198 stop:440 length:243 start_codon:yes stop_codon:yes gene_type:complete
MVINKFIIIEIKELKYRENPEVDFSIDLNCTHGFNSYNEAKKKMDALIELKEEPRKWVKSQYKIIQIPFNSAFSSPKKTA